MVLDLLKLYHVTERDKKHPDSQAHNYMHLSLDPVLPFCIIVKCSGVHVEAVLRAR